MNTKLTAGTTMNVKSESDMLALGRTFAESILASGSLSAVFELIGDVGVGKTTFTRGLAEVLGVKEPITSPSFTISKRYAFPLPEKSSTPEKCCKNYNTNGANIPDIADGQLIHYDFYRLDDPGIMREELAEALAEPNHVIVIEWGSDVADLLPAEKIRLEFALCDDGSRTVKIASSMPLVESSQTNEPPAKTTKTEE